jgi:hypothetical protein
MSPYWLKEAREALDCDEKDRTLDLIEKNAFRRDAPLSAMREAYWLAKRIEGERWPYDLRVRAGKAASQLSTYVDPLGFANAERQNGAQFEARKRDFRASGLSPRRAEALARLQVGPYDVVLAGLTRGCDKQGIHAVLDEIGYPRAESELLLERVEHIAEEPIAYRLHQSEAVRIKVALEAAGAKVRIRAQN